MPVRAAAFRRRRLSLTALIDVIFLLLLFFMLSSTVSRFGEVPFLAGASGPGGAPPALFLRVDGEAVSLNGAPVALAAVPDAVAARLAGNPAPRAIVSVTGRTTSQALVDVLVPLSRVDGLRVTVVE